MRTTYSQGQQNRSRGGTTQKSVLLFKGFHMSRMRMHNLKADGTFSPVVKDADVTSLRTRYENSQPK